MSKTEKHLREAKEFAKQIAAALPDRIQIAALSLNSKLPFKALSLREILIHRVSAIASPAVELFETDRAIPGVVLTRAVLETVALMYALNRRLEGFLRSKNSAELDEFLMRALMGSRNEPELPTAVNVLTLVNHVEKTMPGFRGVYDSLCECTHPNWAGGLGAFGEIDREAFEVKLGPSKKKTDLKVGVSALSGALMTFVHYYDESADLVRQLNDYFEQGGSH